MDKDKPDEHTKKKERSSTTKRAPSEAWLKANKQAISEHNERVTRRGMYNEELRRF